MPSQVLLCTAEVELLNLKTNKTYRAKALLDSGSQSSLLAEKVKIALNLECTSNRVSISGINNTVTNTTQLCDVRVKSLNNKFHIDVSCLVIPHVTKKLPNAPINSSEFNIPSHVKLADPSFFRPSEVNILLGADVFWEIVDTGRINLGRNKPLLQESKLGWLVAGPTGVMPTTHYNSVRCNFSQEVRESLAKFWEIEDIHYSSRLLSKDEEFCEIHFVQNTKRLPDGRFSVNIPMRESPERVLGDSYRYAHKCFLNLEKKLSKQPKLKQDYAAFIREYEELGHLTEIQAPDFHYYLPHHAVIREQSESTKLRVVFNASFKTSSGKSFNCLQLVGPVVQDDLLSILLRFRQNTYVISADVTKMYRQIEVDKSQRHLQLILWRDEETQPLRTLQLNTVTYGTASAPFLSTRCLLQLAEECSDEAVAEVIKHDFYVDDLITGSNSKSDLKHITNGVVQKLREGCFPLCKFRTNSPDLLEGLPITDNTQDFSKQSTVLGLKWLPVDDTLSFSAEAVTTSKITKRTILSTSCKIFDPLGLLSACTIVLKMLLQKLWLNKTDWDERVPYNVEKAWMEFESNARDIASIIIPRHVLCSDPVTVEAHIFVDASQEAYAACVYLKSTDTHGKCSANLLCAKARVAPLKPEMTVPRLELLGAQLGVRLHDKVIKALRIKINRSVFGRIQ